MTDCEHNNVTSTVDKGPHCCDCKEPLVSMFIPISRNTPAGALMYALRQIPREQQA
jgi:hypothetical protein